MATSADYVTKMEENLTCPLCYEVFNHEERAPKGLPCYHTLCLQCLDTFVKKSCVDICLCPLCKETFYVPAGGAKAMRTNIGLKGMIDLLPIRKDDFNTVTKKTNNQNITPSKPLCKLHNDAKCLVICKDCKIPICMECISLRKHRTHKLEDIESALGNLKEKVEVIEEHFKDIVTNHKAVVDKSKTRLQGLRDSVNKKVSQRADEGIQAIRQWKQDVSVEFNEANSLTAEVVEDFDQDFARKKVQVKSQISELKTLARTKYVAAVALCETLTGDLNNLSMLTGEVNRTGRTPTMLTESGFPMDLGHLKNNAIQMYYIINDVESFSKRRPGKPIISQYWYLHEMPFKIVLRLQRGYGEQLSLDVYIQCDHHIHDWECTVDTTVKLVAKPGKPSILIGGIMELHKYNNSEGYQDFISWDRLTDPSNGYVSNNSATIMVTVTTELPADE